MPIISQSCKVIRTALALGCVGLAANATRLYAGDPLSGFYLSTDAGLNLTSDLNASDVSISLRPGVRGDASAGHAWKLGDELSAGAELETGILYNTLDRATTQGQSVAAGGSLTDVPFLAHAVLRWQFHPHWIAYAGAGVGCTFSSLHLSAGGSNYGLTGTDVDFAWQIMAGVHYQIGSSEIGLGYEYFSFRRSGLQRIGNNSIVASYTFCF
jgi:opacity protein-like surface antigen